MLCPASLELSEYVRLTNEGGIKKQTNAVLEMGRAEQLNVICVENNLKMIDKLNRHSYKRKNITKSGSPNRINNLIKVLSIYESEFYARDEKELNKVSKFRSFSIVTELAINWDTEVTNRDAEFKNLTGIPIRKAQNFRKMYYRSKHSDDNDIKHREYMKLQNVRLSQLIYYRSKANAALLKRLRSL